MQPKKTKRQTHGQTGLCELFLLIVPIEEVACYQYKTVQIIFSLNLQTITIAFDAVKWRIPQISSPHFTPGLWLNGTIPTDIVNKAPCSVQFLSTIKQQKMQAVQ